MITRLVLIASVSTALFAAIAAAPAAAAAEDTSPNMQVAAAYNQLGAGDYKSAIATYSEAIESRELEPEVLAHALLNRALAFQSIGQHQSAVDDYSAAIRLDAMSVNMRSLALYNRGIAFGKLGNSSMAVEDFTNALFLNPNFAEAYYSRANVLRESGQFLFALSDYENAAKNGIKDAHLAYFGQAVTYQSLNRIEDAQKALLRCLVLRPDFKPAQQKLVDIAGNDAAARITEAISKKKLQISGPQAALVAADPIVTGSASIGADLIVRKAAVPEAVEPPQLLESAQEGPALVAAVNVTEEPLQDAHAGSPESGEPSEVASSDNQIEIPNADEQAGNAPEETDTENALTGWTIQLSSQSAEDSAWAVWEKLRAQHGKLLSNQEAKVVRADLGSRGVYYRLRVNNLESKGTALRLCNNLKRRGTSCFVSHADS